jgi:hypothetical protein
MLFAMSRPAEDSGWLSPMIGPSMSQLSDVIGPSACCSWLKAFFNEFLHTICACSACHVINWRQRQFMCAAVWPFFDIVGKIRRHEHIITSDLDRNLPAAD